MALQSGLPMEVETDRKLGSDGKLESNGKLKKMEDWDQEQDVVQDVSFVKSAKLRLS